MKKLNKKGFTLAELLIVVAIIAILIAIAIPVFTRQMEKARDSTSLANVRAAFSEASTAALTFEKSGNVTVISSDGNGNISVTVGKIYIPSTDKYLTDTQDISLPFQVKSDSNGIWLTDDITAAGTYTLVFTFSKNGVVSLAKGS